MICAYTYETKIGTFMIAEDGKGITELSLLCNPILMEPIENSIFMETELLREAYKELSEYLEGRRTQFTVSLNPQGTAFQQKVWRALCDIPYGETRSYKQIAQAVGNDKASRAVGMANNKNPIMCMIPCHRVIGANGKMVGYAGGIHIKEQLLRLECGKDI